MFIKSQNLWFAFYVFYIYLFNLILYWYYEKILACTKFKFIPWKCMTYYDISCQIYLFGRHQKIYFIHMSFEMCTYFNELDSYTCRYCISMIIIVTFSVNVCCFYCHFDIPVKCVHILPWLAYNYVVVCFLRFFHVCWNYTHYFHFELQMIEVLFPQRHGGTKVAINSSTNLSLDDRC